MYQFEKDLMTNWILNGDAELAVKRLEQITFFPEDINIDYFLMLAQAEHYTGNQEKTISLYRYLIQNFPDRLLEIYLGMVTHAPEMREIYGVIRTIIASVHDDNDKESIYLELFIDNPQALFTSKQLSFYQRRLLFIIDALEEKTISFKSPGAIFYILAMYQILDRSRIAFHVLERLCNLCIKSIEGLVVEDFVKATPKEKIKVGVCINRYNRIDFQTIIAGLFQSFDPSKFDLIFFAAKEYKNGANFRLLGRIFHKIISYSGEDYKQFRALLIKEKLDVFLSDNAALYATQSIFFSRVAPVQCNIMDSLFSFGAPHMDYYISFGEKNSYKDWALSNPEHVKYALLEDNYIAPAPKRSIATPWDFGKVGLPKNTDFIFYPQILSRMLPEDDIIIKTLLQNNPKLYFVSLVNNKLYKLMLYRWKEVMPEYVDRILLMPLLVLDEFLWVIKQASVVLGSFKSVHGSITDITVFSQGQPLVAGYGNCFSSSLTKFYYQKMGVDGLIAESHDDAIRIAQRLLDDPKWKAEKSAEIKANIHKITDMRKASVQLQDFLLQAYNRAANGLTPEHWQHGNFVDQEDVIDTNDA